MAKARPESDLPRTVEEFERWIATQEETLGIHRRRAGDDGRGLAQSLRSSRTTSSPSCVRCSAGGPAAPSIEGVANTAEPALGATRSHGELSPLDSQHAEHRRAGASSSRCSLPTTESRDSQKWRMYRLIPSLQHFLTVAAGRARGDAAHASGALRMAGTGDPRGAAELTALGPSRVYAIYADTDVPARQPAGQSWTRRACHEAARAAAR